SSQTVTRFIDTQASFPADLAGQGFTHVIHSGSALSITEPAPFTDHANEAVRRRLTGAMSGREVCAASNWFCVRWRSRSP
ncbi:MAG: hypothetical protein SYC29_09255, partial [Planctomycetota bacterium]|nr:hypothetical protein [Planctomycetota bacterium]